MTSEIANPHVLSLRDATTLRLEGIESQGMPTPGGGVVATVALPESYARKKGAQFPLVVVLDAAGMVGSAIEMNRLMAGTKEIRETILVCVEGAIAPADVAGWLEGSLLPWLSGRFRVARDSGVLFGCGTTVDGLGPSATRMRLAVRRLDTNDVTGALRPFTDGLRAVFSTGTPYGQNIAGLKGALTMRLLTLAAPLLGRIMPSGAMKQPPDPRFIFRSKTMDRDFEVFVTLPASWKTSIGRRYPALVVLDANIEFATVAETVARLSAGGKIGEMVVIGVGTPRAEGAVQFGFRRFEEFSPPADGYAYDDDLGRVFRSLFAFQGQDARERLGRAPDLHRFLADELLPRMVKPLSVDCEDIGILGHSAGGCFVGYALTQPESPFRHYISVSPGIGISGWWLMKQSATRPPVARRAENLYVSVGSHEMTNAFNEMAGIPDSDRYATRMRHVPGLRVQSVTFDDETHSSTYPRAVAESLVAIYARGAEPAADAPTRVRTCATI